MDMSTPRAEKFLTWHLKSLSLVLGMGNALCPLPRGFSDNFSIKPSLFHKFRQTGKDGDPEVVPDVVIQVCQLLSFPFALDVDEDTLALILEAVRDMQIPAQLLQVLSWPCVPPFPHTVVTPPYIAVPSAWHHFTSCWEPTQGCNLGAMQPLEKLD